MGGWDEVRPWRIDSSYFVSPGSTFESGDFRGSPGQYTLRNKHTSTPRSVLFHYKSFRGSSDRRSGCILRGLSPSVNPLGERKRYQDSFKDTANGRFVKKKVRKKCRLSSKPQKGSDSNGESYRTAHGPGSIDRLRTPSDVEGHGRRAKRTRLFSARGFECLDLQIENVHHHHALFIFIAKRGSLQRNKTIPLETSCFWHGIST